MGIYHPKTSRTWWAQFQHQGRRQFISLGISYRGKATDRKLAEEAFHRKRSEFIQTVEMGVDIDPKLPLKAVVEEYLRLHAKVHKKSWKHDEAILKRFLSYFGENTPAKRITPNVLEEYKAARQTAEIKRRDQSKEMVVFRPISGARINRELAVLKSMFSKAVLWGRVPDNPVKRVKLFRENRNRERFLTSEEKELLLKHSSDWMRPLLITALGTGMRKGELLSLKWVNVNLDQNVIFIPESKGGRPRHIPMNSEVAEIMKRHPKRGPWVFSREDGTQMDEDGLLRFSFERLRLKLMRQGVPPFVFHDLRHTFGSNLAMKGADAVTIMQLMGHSSLSVTERYMHLSPSHKRVAVEMLVPVKKRSECEYSVNAGIPVEPAHGDSGKISDDK